MNIMLRMETYKITTLDNGDILLQKNIVDNNTYTIINKDNGDILLQKIIDIYNINDINDYDFNEDYTIIYCFINQQEFNKLNYKSILEEIYNLINDGTKIILNTKLSIKTIKKEDHGYYYLENIGISIYYDDNDHMRLIEIINQCKKNKITLSMKIKLLDETFNINF